jgi:LPXTG-motif cell wall-anchored protein
MDVNQLVPSLALVTLGLVAVASLGAFLFFLRKRSNRDAARRALTDSDA